MIRTNDGLFWHICLSILACTLDAGMFAHLAIQLDGTVGCMLFLLSTMKAVEILALLEVRWPGHGVSQLGNAVIAYSGMPADNHCHCHRGVMSERAVSAWKLSGSEFDPVSERIMWIRLKSNTGFVSLLPVCAPTNEPGKEKEMAQFYESLQ